MKAGERVGIVGRSGCGKSTVLKLLQGFYQQTGGRILLDGVALEDFERGHLREAVGVVNQEPTLFNATVLQNILYNKAEGQGQGQGEAGDGSGP